MGASKRHWCHDKRGLWGKGMKTNLPKKITVFLQTGDVDSTGSGPQLIKEGIKALKSSCDRGHRS